MTDPISLRQRLASLNTARQGATPCLACDGKEQALVTTEIAESEQHAGIGVIGCLSCGLGRLDPLPNVNDFYRQTYQDQKNPGQDIVEVRSQRIKMEDTNSHWHRLAERFVPGIQYLDVGCGAGGFIRTVRERAREVIISGVEPHETFRNKMIRDGYHIYASLSECPHRQYDFITLFHVLEHIEQPIEFLKAIRPLLKPDGRLIIEVPSMTDALLWRYSIPKFHKFYWQFPHVWYFSPEPLKRILNKAGFTVPSAKLIQRYGLCNHLQWLNVGKPGPGDQFTDLVSREMDRAYREAIVNQGEADTVWIECLREESCAE